jgi:hypothetical protein
MTPPIVIVAPAAKFEPLTVIRVPPTVGPLFGDTDEIEREGGEGSTGLSPQDIVTSTIAAAMTKWAIATGRMVRAS